MLPLKISIDVERRRRKRQMLWLGFWWDFSCGIYLDLVSGVAEQSHWGRQQTGVMRWCENCKTQAQEHLQCCSLSSQQNLKHLTSDVPWSSPAAVQWKTKLLPGNTRKIKLFNINGFVGLKKKPLQTQSPLLPGIALGGSRLMRALCWNAATCESGSWWEVSGRHFVGHMTGMNAGLSCRGEIQTGQMGWAPGIQVDQSRSQQAPHCCYL